MAERSERFIPTCITVKHELPREVTALLQDLHNDRANFCVGAIIGLVLATLTVVKYLFGTRK